MIELNGVNHPLKTTGADGKEFSLYEFTYKFSGKEYGVYFYAENDADAADRLAAMKEAEERLGKIEGISPAGIDDLMTKN